MKVTVVENEKVEKFDAANAKPGTLMIDPDGDLCVSWFAVTITSPSPSPQESIRLGTTKVLDPEETQV